MDHDLVTTKAVCSGILNISRRRVKQLAVEKKLNAIANEPVSGHGAF